MVLQKTALFCTFRSFRLAEFLSAGSSV